MYNHTLKEIADAIANELNFAANNFLSIHHFYWRAKINYDQLAIGAAL